MKVVTTAQMRDLEAATAQRGLPPPALMENAGRAVAEAIARHYRVAGAHIVVLVGPGNNGGDGLVAARHLHDQGARVTVYLGQRAVQPDAKLDLLAERGVPLWRAEDDPDSHRLRALVAQADIIVDALLGTGISRPITGTLQRVLESLRAARRAEVRLVAVDLPTGLNSDTGQVDPLTPRADLTVTLGFPKRGLFEPPGIDYVGQLVVADIGIPYSLAAEMPVDLMTPALARALLPSRPPSGHKGTFGRVLVVGGSTHYTGAPQLAARSALRVGAGLVTLALPRSLSPAAALVEATHLPLPEAAPGTLGPTAAEALVEAARDYTVMVLGPGLGRALPTNAFIAHLLESAAHLPSRWVIDADALNILAEIPEWWRRLSVQAVLTPHPGEMRRLLGERPGPRLAIAQEAAATWSQVVVLKGAGTVTAHPGGQATINPTANPVLATAGTGDVLAGAIGGLLAQGLTPYDAARLGVYLHAQAGDRASQSAGPAGALASEIADHLPTVLARLRAPTLDQP